ncbi:MAG: AAA family ATPase [Hungatella sp.]|nr:AAA family ATPase [Hungatella sp.]
MAQTIGIGNQDFEAIRRENYFYIDKTLFIKEWWEGGDTVTLITRPRRFGKTLTMNMTEKFFSVRYAERGDLFEGLKLWDSGKFRTLQGTYPVISLSFANVKEHSYEMARRKICQILSNLYLEYEFLLDRDMISPRGRRFFESVSENMDDMTATMAIHQLSLFLSKYYGKHVIILLDEYDTPMQEAYVNGYWEELMSFIRSMFNAAFKTNPYLERAIMTGITRVSKESIFSDLNNLEVVTTTSEKYADCFGFTEKEVFQALDEYGMSDGKEDVKKWYDGFTFGSQKDIYNPWSILNYLDKGKVAPYWANSSSNSLIGRLIREGNKAVKQAFEELMCGRNLEAEEIDEQIVYDQLSKKRNAIWSLLLASGYLKVVECQFVERTGRWHYTLALTNREVYLMFENMVHDWFVESDGAYNDFIKALLTGDVKAMNAYMNKVALATFSYFDTGKNPSREEPERFYHGFVLGLMVELSDRYILTSNRESGFGRYDVVLEPRRPDDDGMILEFKVQDVDDEKELADTVREALAQIDRQKYEVMLVEKGVSKERIRKYGFAFSGKRVLIGGR